VLRAQQALLERLALQVRVQLLSLALQVRAQQLELRQARRQLPQMTCMSLEMLLRKIDQIQGRFEEICAWGFA
jgi:hypothetical protein